MTIHYDEQVLNDLLNLDPIQAHMLLDYFESRFMYSEPLDGQGQLFKTGSWRILFTHDSDSITVLRIIQ